MEPKAFYKAGKHPGGRPLKLSAKVQEDIVTAIRAGNYVETAAAFAGIDKKSLYTWLKKGARGEGKRFIEFLYAVKKAEAESELRSVATIENASRTSWQAAAWRLERKNWKRWGRKDSLEANIRTQHVEDQSRMERTKVFEDQIAEIMPNVGRKDSDGDAKK